MKKSFVRKLVAVISAMVMSVAVMATTANAAAPSGGGASAGTNGYTIVDGVYMYQGGYSLSKEQSGTHYNTYASSVTSIKYQSGYSRNTLTYNCTSYTCTVAGIYESCYMAAQAYVTVSAASTSQQVGVTTYGRNLYGKNGYITPISLTTKPSSTQYLQVKFLLQRYDHATYCNLKGDFKVY